MTPEEFNHATYNLSLGKSGWDLRTTILLSNYENREQFCKVYNIDQSMFSFMSCYNKENLTADILLYNDHYYHLRIACKYGNLSLIYQLLLNDSTFNYSCKQILISYKHNDIFKSLVLQKLIVLDVLTYNYHRLMYENLDLLEWLFDIGYQKFNQVMADASHRGLIDMVKLALFRGANNFDECMVSAVQYGYLNIAKLMLENGAGNIEYCMYVAVSHKQYDVGKFLYDNGGDQITRRMTRSESRKYKETVELIKNYGNY